MTDAATMSGDPANAGRRLPFWVRAGLAAVLVAAAVAAGREGLDFPWMGGDEVVFIAENPLVTGDADGDGTRDRDAPPLANRLWELLGRVHEDLYQPIPLATYAIEWEMWGDARVWHMRLTDVLIHALNGLLLWAVLNRLGVALQLAGGRGLGLVNWALAAVWMLHPIHVGTWAADMGRTHLLSATFTLIALRFYVIALDPRRPAAVLGMGVALTAAMMCKPVVGFVGLAAAIEWATVGLRRALRAPRIYIAATLCAAFAALALYTTASAGMLEETENALFGDRISRSLEAVWIYARNIVAPLAWLATTYLPDPLTGWNYWVVWAGLAVVAASAVVAVGCARTVPLRGVTVGLAWFWALLLPVIGIVGGRVAAAQDRYTYEPLMGVALVLSTLISRWLAVRAAAARRAGLAVGLLAAMAAALLISDVPLAAESRSLLRRAQRIVMQNPGDPRAMRFVVMALEAATVRDTPTIKLPAPPHVAIMLRATLAQTAAAAEARPECFRDARDRAAFHRWLSANFYATGDLQQSLVQARRAADFDADAVFTLTRLAHAYRALGAWDAARALYERLEAALPTDAAHREYRALRLTEFGELLSEIYDRPDLAIEKFRAAHATGVAPKRGVIGLARCEVLVGEGARGYELIRRVLERDRENVDANLVLGMYYLRSHKWQEAEFVYTKLLSRQPTLYPALIGYHELCGQRGAWRAALAAWETAARLVPEERAFQSFLVWAMACAGDPRATEFAEKLLETDISNSFACYALMLVKTRESRWDEAMDLAREGSKGIPVPRARENARARATLRLMADRGELPMEAVFVEAVLVAESGDRQTARLLIESYLSDHPETRFRDHAERLLEGEFPLPE